MVAKITLYGIIGNNKHINYYRLTCTCKTGILTMIKSFRDKETEKIFNQEYSRKFPRGIQGVALRKLIMIDAANSLNDLRVPPGNKLEQLSGNRKGQHSIRINVKYRICFVEDNGDFFDVEIVDYH